MRETKEYLEAQVHGYKARARYWKHKMEQAEKLAGVYRKAGDGRGQDMAIRQYENAELNACEAERFIEVLETAIGMIAE